MKKTINEIKQVAPSYGALPFWSWNDKLGEDELRRQIRNMKDIGMNGFFMHARGGLETEYLSDEWFDCINVCIDEAKKLGMEAWSYDENGWPSGFAGGELLKDKNNFALGVYSKDGPFPEPHEDILGIYVRNEDKSFTRVTEDVGAEKYFIIMRMYDSSYVDTLNEKVIDQFIEVTHEEYKRRVAPEDFGKAMPGFFTDEPQYLRKGIPYSNILPEKFKEAYGYDILDVLPALFSDFDGADKYRYDYYYLVQKLFINGFAKRVYEWCDKNGVMLTGHAIEEESLGMQMQCCAGIMPFYQYQHIPGVDYLGRYIKDDISFRQIGSVCAQIGRKKALSEMFACCGWDVSPTELKRIAEVQYAGGVNLMCHHLYPYSERGQRKRDYPLHHSEHNPWQKHMAEFDNYFTNLGATLSRGTEYAPVLVIHPIHGAYCKYKRYTSGVGVIEDEFRNLSRLLGYNQVPYHYGDEWMMQDMASVENGKIKVGLCEYEAVIVPFTHSLDASTVELLRKLNDCGGKIWLFKDVPPYIDGADACGKLDWLHSTVEFDDILALRKAVVSCNGENANDIRAMTRETEDGDIIYLANIGTKTYLPTKVELPLGNWAELDMNTLEVLPVNYENTENSTVVTLRFVDAEAHVLVRADDIAAECAPAPFIPEEIIPVPDTLKLAKHPVNMINLDFAELSKDGVNYDEPLAVMGIKDNLLREKYSGVVYLKFKFDLDYDPAELAVAVEPMYQRITVNGTEITLDPDKYFFDRSFKTADIVGLVHRGENEIIIEVNHYQRDYVYYVLYGGVSESLRNCLVFDVEIECIYLIGDFALRTEGEFTDRERNSVVYDGSFVLTNQPDTVPADNIVKGGFPFYCGPVTTEFTYNYKKGDPTWLQLDGRFATAEVEVNGKEAGHMMFLRTLDLAEFLREGDNTVRVTICNSMRNLMGPHHRHDPEPYSVGPGTFSFEKEWHGRECGGFRSTYSFVKFGLKKNQNV